MPRIITCGYAFNGDGLNYRPHACAAEFDHYADYARHVWNGQHLCRCGVGVEEMTDERERDEGPEEGPDEEPEPEPSKAKRDGGIITADKLHMGILGNWIGWEAHEGGDRRTAPVRMVRGGKLESYAISEMYMDPVIIVVSGEEYRVGPSQHFIWRRA